jgi:very-short-patch-repair endonuclease
MNYSELSDNKKKEIIVDYYSNKKNSFADIANRFNTYANKIRRDAIRYGINIRDKSEAQKNALDTGKTKHPTKGTKRPEETKQKIGASVMDSWDNLSDQQLNQRKQKAKENWDKLPDITKENILREANVAVREASKKGSKLELFLLEKLLSDGYVVEFHKEQNLLNTKLQIDLFLPNLNIAIEVDGPSHFEPVWGNDVLSKNKKYDNKKTGLILGKGLSLIRIKQTKDFSKSRANKIYQELIQCINTIDKIGADKVTNLGDK